MGLINYSSIEDGTGIDAADVNTPLTTIYNDYNGNIDSNNLAANAVTTVKITDANVTHAKVADNAIEDNNINFAESFIYSTTETAVGKWIDGSTVYQKVVALGTGPNATAKTVNHNISNLSVVIQLRGIASVAGTWSRTGSPYGASSTAANYTPVAKIIMGAFSDGTVIWETTYNATGETGYAIITYTKSA